MKKLLFFAAATAVALSSCSKDEVTTTVADAQKAISFSTYSAAATKAYTETTSMTDYTVQAVYTNDYSVFASNIAVANSTYTGTLYWPFDTSATLDFIAYSAGVTYSTIDSDGADLTLSSHAGEADLVAAYEKEQSSETASTEGAVSLTFKHLLSLINTTITADTEDTSLSLYITDVTYTSIDSGTATVTNANTTTWTTTGSDELTSQVISSSTEITGASSDSSTAAIITVIPQTISVAIKGYWEQGGVKIDDFSTTAKTVSTLAVEAGKSYTYNFKIAPNVTTISFSATVSGWDTTGGITTPTVE